MKPLSNSKFMMIIVMAMPFFSHANEAVKCIPNSVVHNEILGCFIQDFNKVDKELNVIYKKKMSSLNHIQKIKLKKLQREWIKEKQSNCTVDETNYGRESHFEAIQCEIDMTKERIAYLKKY